MFSLSKKYPNTEIQRSLKVQLIKERAITLINFKKSLIHVYARLFTDLIAYPLDTIYIKIAFQGINDAHPRLYKNFIDCAKSIYSQQGIKGFYAGFQYALFPLLVEPIFRGLLLLLIFTSYELYTTSISKVEELEKESQGDEEDDEDLVSPPSH